MDKGKLDFLSHRENGRKERRVDMDEQAEKFVSFAFVPMPDPKSGITDGVVGQADRAFNLDDKEKSRYFSRFDCKW